MPIHSAIPGPSRRKQAALLVAAGILSIVGTGTIMGWSAIADPRPTTFDEGEASVTHVDLDSLYTAQAAAAPTTDTSFIATVRPERTISGNVSWYGPGFHGHRTANGERFDSQSLTAAHKTLPFGTLVRVIDTQSGKSTLVRINDRGPFCRGRILDLSEGAARHLGIRGKGTASVRLEIYPSYNAQTEENDDRENSRKKSTLVTFDASGQAVMLRGYSVQVKECRTFEEARAIQNQLAAQGYEKVFLTQNRSAGSVTYQVSLGLFGSQRLCQGLMAELADDFNAAEMVRFDKGKVVSMNLAGAGESRIDG
jgi:rare lipoprotein A